MITWNSARDIVLDSDDVPFGTGEWYLYAGISCLLVLFAGIMSGLTLGLMSLNLVDLEILQRSGTSDQKKQAAAILPVVKKQHQLLVTLLLCNAAAMEALPLYLDEIFHPVVAVLLSVTFVLIFGEIIPQAVCSRYGLSVGSNFVWLVRILMIICYPIAYPIGKVLDLALGHGDDLFRRAQLKALVSIHGLEAGKGGELTHDETTIISGALDLTEKTAEEAMTPIESTFSLDVNSKLDWEAIGKILARGHSRVPVYSGNPKNIIGLLLVKSLLTVRAETETPVSAVSIRRMPRVPANMPLYDILNEFQKGSSHLAAVVKIKGKTKTPLLAADREKLEEARLTNGCVAIDVDKRLSSLTNMPTVQENDGITNGISHLSEDIEDGEVIGIITLEDVFEELLQEEIVDETDVYIDVHKRIRVAAAAAASSMSRAQSSQKLIQKHAAASNKQGTTPKKSGEDDPNSTRGCGRWHLCPLLYIIITHKTISGLDMGVNAVFSSLKEIFPQVDFRLLRGVALEHANDLDAAVEDVLNEVLPFLTNRPGSPAKIQSPTGEPTEVKPLSIELIHRQVEKEVEVEPSPAVGYTDFEDANNNDHTEFTSASFHELSTVVDDTSSSQNFPAARSPDVDNAKNTDHTEFTSAVFHEVSTLVDDTKSLQNVPDSSDVDQATGHQEQECVNSGSRDVETVGNVDVGLQQSSSGMATSSVYEKEGVHDCSINEPYEWKDFDFSQHDSLAGSHFEGESSIVQLDPPFPEHVPETVLSKEDDSFCDLADDMKEATTNSICNIDVLEESIEDAKHNKKTLFSAMESVITMMREVELEEKAVDRVREEAARGGQDIMVKVEELKDMLAHAKEANDMHAGEVYGEKAILATEVRELQCRLLGLSDERDKSLAILDEMRETLEARLAGVAELRKMAEDEKLEKEESARKALAEQEAIMEKVVEESRTLQQAAEENSKLREFLMDRGHIVDMLQGEISVICQDVKLLKEKFDERVPLSQSVSSSQTSCILASSGSSLKSVASGLLLERVGSVGSSESPNTLERVSPVASVDGLSPKFRQEYETIKADKQALMEDGWDVFDDDLLE
ncbi:hypothetical protein ACLB2K_015755 [Fragaria x ananassa]